MRQQLRYLLQNRTNLFVPLIEYFVVFTWQLIYFVDTGLSPNMFNFTRNTTIEISPLAQRIDCIIPN